MVKNQSSLFDLYGCYVYLSAWDTLMQLIMTTISIFYFRKNKLKVISYMSNKRIQMWLNPYGFYFVEQ